MNRNRNKFFFSNFAKKTASREHAIQANHAHLALNFKLAKAIKRREIEGHLEGYCVYIYLKKKQASFSFFFFLERGTREERLRLRLLSTSKCDFDWWRPTSSSAFKNRSNGRDRASCSTLHAVLDDQVVHAFGAVDLQLLVICQVKQANKHDWDRHVLRHL